MHALYGHKIANRIRPAPILVSAVASVMSAIRGARRLWHTRGERSQRRETLERSQEFSVALVSSIVDAVASFDRLGRVQDWNPAMASLTGRSWSSVASAPVSGLLPFLASADEARVVSDALLRRETELPFVRTTHESTDMHVWLDVTVTPMRNVQGEIIGGLLVARDVTERHRVSEMIMAAKDSAEHANRSKSDFLARMSHELRTPLNAMIGFTNVLRRNPENRLARDQLTYLDRVNANGRHLLTLINEILDISRIESGHETITLAKTDVSTLVRTTVGELEERASDAGIQLHLVTPWGATTTTDEAKLKQVLINLVGNAIKFTPRHGHVFVRVAVDGATETATRIDVEDTGIGIPENRLHAIFEAFEQADDQTSRRFGGTGLGLAISQKLCAMMGHDLVVDSEHGRGSTFSVVLAA